MLSKYSPTSTSLMIYLLKNVVGFKTSQLFIDPHEIVYRVFHSFLHGGVTVNQHKRQKIQYEYTFFVLHLPFVYYLICLICSKYHVWDIWGVTSLNRPLLVVGTLTCTNLRCEIFSGSSSACQIGFDGRSG